jgi:hypothetical protein|tara:strand:- start:1401 stop:1874 length:474 start_codon:yes stop_codon:yes gene_type:complete
MAAARTKSFEVFETITANLAGQVKAIDLNTFVQVADMEAFGIQSIEVGIDATALTPTSAEYMAQVSLDDLAAGFQTHAEFASLFLDYTDVPAGYTDSNLSLGNVAQIRYVPGGTMHIRADRMSGTTDTPLYVRITGVISKLSASDYVSLALSSSMNA